MKAKGSKAIVSISESGTRTEAKRLAAAAHSRSTAARLLRRPYVERPCLMLMLCSLCALCLFSPTAMADAASSSAAKPGSRQALLQKQRAARELAEKHAEMLAKQEAERKAMEEQMAAMAVGGAVLDSTLERSLRENLVIAHGEVMGELGEDQDIIELLESNKYDEEDMILAEFWESGVKEPADLDDGIIEALSGKKKDNGNLVSLGAESRKAILTTILKWKAAFTALDAKFIARALLARELKVVFSKKREQVRSHAIGRAQMLFPMFALSPFSSSRFGSLLC